VTKAAHHVISFLTFDSNLWYVAGWCVIRSVCNHEATQVVCVELIAMLCCVSWKLVVPRGLLRPLFGFDVTYTQSASYCTFRCT